MPWSALGQSPHYRDAGGLQQTADVVAQHGGVAVFAQGHIRRSFKNNRLNLGGDFFAFTGILGTRKFGFQFFNTRLVLPAKPPGCAFGVEHGVVIGIIAGGDSAIRKAVEFAEDSHMQGWLDLQDRNITDKDVVIGIAASGSTPYVIGALVKCNEKNVTTACITCNEGSPLSKVAQYPIEAVVGPEFVTGSTRMKAGTAQKLILNMISTAVMIKLGKVRGNKMVDMKLSNNKLVDRGARMVMDELKIEMPLALELLKIHGSVRAAVDNYKK